MRSNKMFLTLLAACSLGLITTGCSTVNKMTGNSDPDRMVEVEVSKEAVDEMQIPAWFIEKENPNTDKITVTATDISKDMQFAIDKATLNAKVQLAQKLKTDVSSLVRESTLENGFGTKDVEKETDRVSKALTRQAVGYYKRENLKVVRDKDYYRAFVKLTLSIDEARRLTDTSQGGSSREQLLKELDGDTQPVPQTGEQVSVIQPVVGTSSTFSLLDVDNEEYKARRAEALKKPGAVVGRVTIR